MVEVLFSTAAFMQILGLDHEAAFWVVGVALFAILATLLTAISISIFNPIDEEEADQ